MSFRLPSKFRQAVALWCAALSTASAGLPERQAVEQLVSEADLGRPVFDLVDAAGERGIPVALVCAEYLDEQKPARSQALYQVISHTANGRRLHAEILRLYAPESFSLFYTPEGVASQRLLAQGLEWKSWPAALPEALVRAAPIPTLEWLQKQAASQAPALEKLRLLLPPLAWWLRTYSERAATAGFQQVIGELAANSVITDDEQSGTALLSAVAAARAFGTLAFVLREFHSALPGTRGAAVDAVGQMLSPQLREGTPEPSLDADRARTLPEFLQLGRAETDATVAGKVATAAEAWVDAPEVGQAMLDLFTRLPDAATQRNILFAVGKTRWPQRAQIIQLGLEATGNGVRGVALEAVAVHPLPELAPATLALLSAQKEAQPLLIDAAGALGDPRALPTLLRWLERERNPAIVLKLAAALERIPGDASARALSELLGHSVDPMVVEALCRLASHRELKGAASVLVSLAEDLTAPLSIRGLAVWALGRYRDAEARECLARLGQEPEKYFPAEGQLLLPELVEQARLYVALARLRQGEASMESEVTRLFQNGTPAARLTCLFALAEIKRDNPVIATALQSREFAVLLGGVKAAGAAAPAKYLGRLRELRASPIFASLATSGLDTWRLPILLDEAIQAGENP